MRSEEMQAMHDEIWSQIFKRQQQTIQENATDIPCEHDSCNDGINQPVETESSGKK